MLKKKKGSLIGSKKNIAQKYIKYKIKKKIK